MRSGREQVWVSPKQVRGFCGSQFAHLKSEVKSFFFKAVSA